MCVKGFFYNFQNHTMKWIIYVKFYKFELNAWLQLLKSNEEIRVWKSTDNTCLKTTEIKLELRWEICFIITSSMMVNFIDHASVPWSNKKVSVTHNLCQVNLNLALLLLFHSSHHVDASSVDWRRWTCSFSLLLLVPSF